MSVPTFMDVQGFFVGTKFVVKKVAVLRKETVLANLLTRSDKSCASWLIANHHGLRWEDGNVPYNLAKYLITSAVLRMSEREWLMDLLENYARKNLIIETLDADYEDINSLNNLDVANTIRCGKHVKNCLPFPSLKFQSINLPSPKFQSINHHIILFKNKRHVFSVLYYQCRVNRFTSHNLERCTLLKKAI
ncbi:hypothetical protein ACFW04_014679 [Cataglyphis niger]